jgi:spermidine/putrescine transport system substrate-binding protein
MFNNSRDAFAIAQAMLGKDVNTTNEQDWVEAAELLAKQKDAVNPVYVMDEVFNLMESGEYAFATYYSGDYELMIDNNPDLGFCFPKEGVNEFFDAFCVPKCSQNKKGAEAFINFMHEPQVAFDNAEYIYYASPNTTVSDNEESSLYGSEAVYPTKEGKNLQHFKNLPQNILELQNTLWSQVKSGKLSSNSKKQERKIYILSAILAAGVIVILIFSFINRAKKRKEQDLTDLYSA